MKILLTAHQFFPVYASGTEVLTLSVARELIARGHEVRVLTGFPSGQMLRDEARCDEYEYEGIHVYRFHHAYVAMGGQTSKIEIGYDNHLAAEYFRKILQAFQPDVVHFFHLNRLGTGLIEHAARAGIPAFMTPTDFWAICPTGQLVLPDGKLCNGPGVFAGNCVKHFAQSTQKGLVGKVAQWLPASCADGLVRLTNAGVLPPYPQRIEVKGIASRLKVNVRRMNLLNKIISPNRFMTEKLVQHGVLPGHIVESAFGIDINGQQQEKYAPRQPFRVGYIGTLAPHKGCHILMDAFMMLPLDAATLKIYGNEADFPEYSAELKLLAAGRNNIEFCGVFHNSAIAAVMADLDVLVVPSLWFENTPLVIYSSQAAGRPVVGSDFPGISEVIRDEENGLLFEPGNVAALAAQLARFIDEPDLAARLSANSRSPKSTANYVDELLVIWQNRE